MSADSFHTRADVTLAGESVEIFSLKALERAGFAGVATLPYSLKILLENLLRHEDERFVHPKDIEALAGWKPGAHIQKDRQKVTAGIERVYEYFPRLKERRSVQSGYLSGGEQQMLVIGRALMANPHVMLLDEPSLGLAPMLVEEIFGIVQQLNQQEKLTVLLVEQNAALALTIAEHGYVMENGRIVLEGSAEALRDNADIKEFYLGLTEVGARKSYRDVKHYKRRKRWLS